MLLSQHIVAFLNKRSSVLESLHVSDVYTGYLPEGDDSSDTIVVRKTQKRIQMTYKSECMRHLLSAAVRCDL